MVLSPLLLKVNFIVLKNFVIICLTLLYCDCMLAQSNASIYLKDGSNFDFETAFNFSKDSLSLQFSNQTTLRISFEEIKKVILYHGYFNHSDTVKTIVMNDGKRYSARHMVNFKNGHVNVLLINDDEISLPLEAIKSLTVIQEIKRKDTIKSKRISYGLSCMYGISRDAPRGIQPELSVYYKLGSNLSIGILAGQYFLDKQKELFPNTDLLSGTKLPKTSNQLNANNAINPDKFKKTSGQNNINKNLIYLGLKASYYLFGSKIENAASLGLHCYFGGAKSTLQAETDWMSINRTILINDTITGLPISASEPILAKVKNSTDYKRKTFLIMDWSYQVKCKLYSKLYLYSDLGLFLGFASVIKTVQINAEYNYKNGNIYNDETSFSKQFSDTQRASFEQVYLKVGLMF